MSIHGSHVLLQGSLLVDVPPLMHPKPLSGSLLSQLFLLVYSGRCCFPGQELLPHNTAALKPWRCQTRLQSLQPSQRCYFLTEKQELLSLQPNPPCHGALLWHICALNISLQRTCPFHFTGLQLQASLPMKLKPGDQFCHYYFFLLFSLNSIN